MDNILSVRQVTEKIRQALESRLPYVWVRGEVINLSRPGSGHIYFALKEDEHVLPCVWFSSQQAAQGNFDPMTGEVWEGGARQNPALTMANGQTVLCAGRLSIYAPRGTYQMHVDFVQEAGLGRWFLAFEELKRELSAKGYFAGERKRNIPVNPRRVALITSLKGAAIQDFLRISSARGLGSRIRVFPVLVQGEEAPEQIAAALAEANAQAWAEVAVLIRGGGSIQDLWAFNDERVARAIFESRLPVLTGVGHEIDQSIADFVADSSAATPSHAAQMLWQEREHYEQSVDGLEERLADATFKAIQARGLGLEHVRHSLDLLSPILRLNYQAERLADNIRRLPNNILNILAARERHLLELNKRLAAAVAGRQQADGEQLRAASDLLRQTGQFWRLRADALENMTRRLTATGKTLLTAKQFAFEKHELQLRGLNPLSPLTRGYALLRKTSGSYLRGVRETAPGESLAAEMIDGQVQVVVRQVEAKQSLAKSGA